MSSRNPKRGARVRESNAAEADRQLTSAVDEAFPPFPVRTLADMSDDEIEALERLYGVMVKR